MVNVFVEDGDYLIKAMVRSEFGWQIQRDLTEDTDVVIFSGGADVSPELYGERNVGSYCNPTRDEYCVGLFEAFKGPKIGICRGAQFLNVVSGGRMWQDVDNHGRSHLVRDQRSLKEYYCTSTHHQMMRPGPDAQVVGIASPARSMNRISATEVEKFFAGTDIEVLWYETTNSLCFQPHPEYDGHPECTQYFSELVSEFFPQLLAEG
jgi:anthranilate/para-aminobenzoate synthase component II